MALADIKNFVDVSPTLATAGQPSEDQLREVAAAGFDVVVNLGLLDPRYCLADEAGVVASAGLGYCHIPVNFQTPQLEDLDAFMAEMDTLRAQDRKVFVHCAANFRVSSFVALYGEAKLGWSRAEADAHIARVWHPNPDWRAFIARARERLGRP